MQHYACPGILSGLNSSSPSREYGYFAHQSLQKHAPSVSALSLGIKKTSLFLRKEEASLSCVLHAGTSSVLTSTCIREARFHICFIHPLMGLSPS
jgi:hypothetical protein